jgi:hypothetical protein
MTQGQAFSLMTEEMDDVKIVLALKSKILMNKLKENRRYVQVVF